MCVGGGGGELFSAAELKNIPRQLLSHVIIDKQGHISVNTIFPHDFLPPKKVEGLQETLLNLKSTCPVDTDMQVH